MTWQALRRWLREMAAPVGVLLAGLVASQFMPGITPEGWVAISLSAFVAYLFVDHAVHSIRFYRRERGIRALRGLMLSLLLGAGVLGILMGNVARYVPELADVARFVRWVTVGMLFVGGITTWITWRWGSQARND